MSFFDFVTPNDVETLVSHQVTSNDTQEKPTGSGTYAGAIRRTTVTVVIPTYDDSERLAQALTAIYRLQAPKGECEIVIVDDGSTDDTPDQIREMAQKSPWPFLGLRLNRNWGRSIARNVGVQHASGQVIAFTDTDCVPSRQWLMAALPHFDAPQVGIVQGQTLPVPGVPRPLASHFMEVTQEDGHFATCNIFYRRQVLLDAGGFNPRLDPNGSPLGTWEDVDIGWRVLAQSWQLVFEPKALVYHQIVPISLSQWLVWSVRLGRRPEIAARYPAYRRFLYRRIWIDRSHAWLTLALLGGLLSLVTHPFAALLAAPYLFEVRRRYGLAGRWPLAKLALHVNWDLIGFATLLIRSVRFGCVVL